MKDEGIVFSILGWFSLAEAKPLWRVQRLFHAVLDRKVVPLLALEQRDWGIVGHYLDLQDQGGHVGFHYNLQSICLQALRCEDFDGLELLARRNFNFATLHANSQLAELRGEAFRLGKLSRLNMLRSLGLASEARPQLGPDMNIVRFLMIDFQGARLSFRCTGEELALTEYVDQQLAAQCVTKEHLYRLPYVLAGFLRIGASACPLVRPGGSGYLLLLAIASESFNFVYLLVKEAVCLSAVLQYYAPQFLQIALRALSLRRFVALDLLAFCRFQLGKLEELQWQQLDKTVVEFLLREDCVPVEKVCSLGYSLARIEPQLRSFLEARFLAACGRAGSSATEEVAALRSLKLIAAIDRSLLEVYFRSSTFLDFATSLLASKSFVELRTIVQIHRYAFTAFFAANYGEMEAIVYDAFLLRNISLILDMSSINFPMGTFFARREAEIDSVLLGWLASKSWPELNLLKHEVSRWDSRSFFYRTQARTDALVVGIIEHGYWYNLHSLSQLSFEFEEFFDRCFSQVSAAVLQFIALPQPHFVLLRELSGLGFPWPRFLQEHVANISQSKDHDFLQFVFSLEGFELGSNKVYTLVEQTCRLYRSMAADMFYFVSEAAEEGSKPNPSTDEATPVMADCEEEEKAALVANPTPSSPSSELFLSPRPLRGGWKMAGVRNAEEIFAATSDLASGGTLPYTSSSSSSSSSFSPAAVLSSLTAFQPASPHQSVHLPASLRAKELTPRAATAAKAKGAPPAKRAGPDPLSEEAQLVHSKALAMARKALRRKLNAHEAVLLTIYKGAYCWNPFQADGVEPESNQGIWPDVEHFLVMMHDREDTDLNQACIAYSQLVQLTPVQGALFAFLPPPHAAAQGGIPAMMPFGGPAGNPGHLGAQAAQAAQAAPAAVAASHIGAAQPVLVHRVLGGALQHTFHIACLAQRSEDRLVSAKIEPFWDIILPLLPTREAF